MTRPNRGHYWEHVQERVDVLEAELAEMKAERDRILAAAEEQNAQLADACGERDRLREALVECCRTFAAGERHGIEHTQWPETFGIARAALEPAP